MIYNGRDAVFAAYHIMKLENSLYFYPESGMLDCNTYVVPGNPGIIIDPGSPQHVAALLRDMRQDGVNPEEIGAILNTHLHLDHSWGDITFREATGARIILHPRQKEFYDVAVDQTAQFFGLEAPHIQEDECLEDNVLKVGNLTFTLIPSPGHSPDSICYYCAGEKLLICGDVLFERNTGRVDLPGGSAAELKESIESLSKLEIEHLLPGHMGPVSGVRQVRENFDFIRDNVLSWL